MVAKALSVGACFDFSDFVSISIDADQITANPFLSDLGFTAKLYFNGNYGSTDMTPVSESRYNSKPVVRVSTMGRAADFSQARGHLRSFDSRGFDLTRTTSSGLSPSGQQSISITSSGDYSFVLDSGTYAKDDIMIAFDWLMDNPSSFGDDVHDWLNISVSQNGLEWAEFNPITTEGLPLGWPALVGNDFYIERSDEDTWRSFSHVSLIHSVVGGQQDSTIEINREDLVEMGLPSARYYRFEVDSNDESGTLYLDNFAFTALIPEKSYLPMIVGIFSMVLAASTRPKGA